MAEIEVKYPLDPAQVNRLRARLQEIGAKSEGSVFERNVTYDDDQGTLQAGDQLLRLRQANKVTLTYKGARDAASRFKNREELEVVVSDFTTMADILDRLGYRPRRQYEKERETWHWRDVEILVDRLPFGWFLEIEGPPPGIEAAEQVLGLDPASRNTQNYYEIYDDYCRQRGLTPGDIVFEK